MDRHTRLIDWRETDFVDANLNGIDDALEPPATAFDASGDAWLDGLAREAAQSVAALSAGELDAGWDDGVPGGDEALGLTPAAPGHDIVDGIGRAVGRVYADDEPLDARQILERDRRRWELDPASAERDE